MRGFEIMARTLTVATGVLVLCGTIGASATTPQTPGQEFRIAQNEERILTEPGLPSANDLEVRANCDRVNAGLPLAVFSWTAADGYKSRQRVEITPYRTGFAAKSYEAIGELEDNQKTLEWGGGEAGINYYWRVLTRTPDGWVASDTARYEVPTCPVDFERPKKISK